MENERPLEDSLSDDHLGSARQRLGGDLQVGATRIEDTACEQAFPSWPISVRLCSEGEHEAPCARFIEGCGDNGEDLFNFFCNRLQVVDQEGLQFIFS